MKIYNALIKKNKEGQIRDIVLIKEGFSFFAFLFSALWFLFHRMWREFFILLLVGIVFNYIYGDKVLLEIAFFFLIAFNANYWFCEHMKNKGYEFAGLVFGNDCESAKLRFIKNSEDELSSAEFDDSIINPKLHRKMMKLKKSKKYIAS